MAASSALWAIGPTVSSVRESGVTPKRLVKPKVGFIPVSPHSADGMRIEPPVSVPSARGAKPAATAAPEPALEPPGIRSSFHGLLGMP